MDKLRKILYLNTIAYTLATLADTLTTMQGAEILRGHWHDLSKFINIIKPLIYSNPTLFIIVALFYGLLTYYTYLLAILISIGMFFPEEDRFSRVALRLRFLYSLPTFLHVCFAIYNMVLIWKILTLLSSSVTPMLVLE